MANYLNMTKRQQVIGLLSLNWSFRRIERETGVRRETVAKYAVEQGSKPAKVFAGSDADDLEIPGDSEGEGSKPAKVFAGSAPGAVETVPAPRRRAVAAEHHATILEKLDAGLSYQRIYQDLRDEFAYRSSYESIKRYARALRPQRRAFEVMHGAPGEEAQVDYFQGAPTLCPKTGEWRRPWVFRMTLCHSRHGYEEAVWDQKLPAFLSLHERAFRDLGGVPEVVRHDNLKAAVVRACLFDPDIQPVYEAFAKHWGFTPLPTRPRNPRENGKQERSGGYVKDNALKARRFDSLEEQNAHLRQWNRTVARLRIHGTTRRQVWSHFQQTDLLALQPLANERFQFFQQGQRSVHPDGHVEVEGGFYPAPPHLVFQKVTVRWDGALVRIFEGENQVALHLRVQPGMFARREGTDTGPTSSQRAMLNSLLERCRQVGSDLHEWARQAHAERGVRALRLIQGALQIVRKHPREAVLAAARSALQHRAFRYKDLRRLAEMTDSKRATPRLTEVHEAIRPMNDYRLEEFL